MGMLSILPIPMPEPVNPDAIAALPGVHHLLQAHRNFQSIHAASAPALELLDASRNTLAIASEMTEKTGLGMIFRMQVTTTDGHLMLFSLNPQIEHPPGPRVFGVETDPTTQMDVIAASITPLL